MDPLKILNKDFPNAFLLTVDKILEKYLKYTL